MNDPNLSLLKEALTILSQYPVFGVQSTLEGPLTPTPYRCEPEPPKEDPGPLVGPEHPLEAFRGEGWCDDILLPPPLPPGPITPAPPCSEGPAAPGDPMDESEDYSGDESMQGVWDGPINPWVTQGYHPDLRQEKPPRASGVNSTLGRTVRITGELPECFRPTTHM